MGRAAANVTEFPGPRKKLGGLVCSDCGARADASCNCGVAYVPAASAAAKALKEHPEKSDRAIAAEIGVSHTTVIRTRKKSTGTNVPVAKRIGKDGKTRKMPKPKAKAKAKKLKSNDIEQAREFGLEAATLSQRLTERFYPWLEAAELPNDALRSLVRMFTTAAQQFEALAEAAEEKMKEK